MIVALVSVETVLLVVVLVLVAGLLRSNAALLRRLGEAGGELPDAPGAESGALPAPPATARRGRAAPPIAGLTPDGDAVKLDFAGGGAGPTLLAFLSSGCAGCGQFWDTLGPSRLAHRARIVIVTRGRDRERPGKLRSLAPEGAEIVMSSPAWEQYGVPGSPYFVLVDGAIRGEGAAPTWPALASLVGDAIEDQLDATPGPRAQRIEETLAAAGIGPDHPSLRPSAIEVPEAADGA